MRVSWLDRQIIATDDSGPAVSRNAEKKIRRTEAETKKATFLGAFLGIAELAVGCDSLGKCDSYRIVCTEHLRVTACEMRATGAALMAIVLITLTMVGTTSSIRPAFDGHFYPLPSLSVQETSLAKNKQVSSRLFCIGRRVPTCNSCYRPAHRLVGDVVCSLDRVRHYLRIIGLQRRLRGSMRTHLLIL